MSITAKIICDSVAPNGKRLITFELMYPRIIHSEFMTHRALSKNAASSRAIPIEKMIQRILDDTAMPVYWGANQKGMQASGEVDDIQAAKKWWMESMQLAVEQARKGVALGLHKQIVNRVTEPYQHMVTVASGTEWANFFHLRYHPAAQPEFQQLAKFMYQMMQQSKPRSLGPGEWHLPYIRPEDRAECYQLGSEITHDPIQRAFIALEMLKKVSTGRCARTSYVNQNGVRDLKDDIGLHDRLCTAPDSSEPGHWSPFEHIARAESTLVWSGNFCGWTQYRKMFPNENTVVMPNLG